MRKLRDTHNESAMKSLFWTALNPQCLYPFLKYMILKQVPKIYICTMIFGSPLALAQEIVCVPPSLPQLPADLETQIEYKQELAQEYNDYFRFAAEYLNCLNASGSNTRADIQTAISQFNHLLDLPNRSGPNVADSSNSYLLQ